MLHVCNTGAGTGKTVTYENRSFSLGRTSHCVASVAEIVGRYACAVLPEAGTPVSKREVAPRGLGRPDRLLEGATGQLGGLFLAVVIVLRQRKVEDSCVAPGDVHAFVVEETPKVQPSLGSAEGVGLEVIGCALLVGSPVEQASRLVLSHGISL